MKHLVLAAAMAAAVSSLAAQPQSQWQWPDKPKNIQALPKTVTGQDLRRIMFSYTGGLGVRCTYCHVGEEGKDFSTFDFAADSKPAKAKARTMITMVQTVNTQFLAKLDDGKPAGMEVSCATCHRGVSSPLPLEDRLKKTYDQSGLDSAVRAYRALREQYYGASAYNFKEGALLRLADKIADDSTKFADAVAVVKLNIEQYPSFAFSFTHLASWYEDRKDIPAAIENYQKALALNPKNEMIKRRLDKLQGR